MEYDDRSPEDIEWASRMLEEAIGAGEIETVRHYIPLADPNYLPTALWMAAMGGVVEAVELLSAVTDPKYQNSRALNTAAGEGHLECVKLLMPLSEPHDFSSALFEALFEEHMDIAELLCPGANLDDALQQLKDHPYQYPSIKDGIVFLEQRIAHQQRARLLDELPHEAPQRVAKL